MGSSRAFCRCGCLIRASQNFQGSFFWKVVALYFSILRLAVTMRSLWLINSEQNLGEFSGLPTSNSVFWGQCKPPTWPTLDTWCEWEINFCLFTPLRYGFIMAAYPPSTDKETKARRSLIPHAQLHTRKMGSTLTNREWEPVSFQKGKAMLAKSRR